MLGMTTTSNANTTGVRDIAESLGGGIREGSLVLIEGGAKAGKSVLSQHVTYGVLCAKDSSVAYYTLDANIEDLIVQMDSLSLETRHDFVTDRFRIYSLGPAQAPEYAEKELQNIITHISYLPDRFKLIVIDSAAPLMAHVSTMIQIDFLQSCKELCENGRSIVLALDTHIFERRTISRAYAMSDYYIRLTSQDMMLDAGQVDTRVVKVLEVIKIAGAERPVPEGVKFEIKPRIGIQILPFVKVKV